MRQTREKIIRNSNSASVETMLQTSHLDIGFRKQGKALPLLQGLDLSAARGELIAIVGRNGAGKSTLLRTLMRIQPPLAGDILLQDGSLLQMPLRMLARRISFVSTEPVRVSNMTVQELVALGRHPYTNWMGVINASHRLKVKEALKNVGMEQMENARIDEISDGERQKAMIGRTIAQDCDIIILDEPTAFLDMPNRYEIIALLQTLARENGKCILFSTHDLSIALAMADKLWLFESGQITQGAPEDLAIAGKFNALLQDSSLLFNAETGEFALPKTSRGIIALKGKGTVLNWTRRMLERIHIDATFEENAADNDGIIEIISTTETIEWEFIQNNEKMRFSSLYALAKHLSLVYNAELND